MKGSRLIDISENRGIFKGNLAYGRKRGQIADKHNDYSGEDNLPVCPLILVDKRDPDVWMKDLNIKIARQHIDNSQHGVNYLLQQYKESNIQLKANIHLTIGKQKW